ncbi:MAG: hypothetical protein PHX18_02670 [Candidatus Gastranaerophilales bacterium]|nr:hypothetical protein [Candidatus Gastranaerophilales bacterium]
MGNEAITAVNSTTSKSTEGYDPHREYYKQLLAARGVDVKTSEKVTKPEIADIPVFTMQNVERATAIASKFGLNGNIINSTYTTPALAQAVPASTKPVDITPKTLPTEGHALKSSDKNNMDLSSALASNTGSQFSGNSNHNNPEINTFIARDDGLEVRRELALG